MMLYIKPLFPLVFMLAMLNCSSSSKSSKITTIKREDQAHYTPESQLKSPNPKILNQTNQNLEVKGGITFNNIEGIRAKYPVVVSALEKLTEELKTNRQKVEIDIVKKQDINSLNLQIPSDFMGKKEGYILKIESNKIKLLANDTLGLINGLSSLENWIKQGNGVLKQGEIIDWPDHEVRVLHFSIKKINTDVIKTMLDRARTGHFNTVMLYIKNSVNLKCLKNLSYSYAIEPSEFVEVVKYARESGMRVIPTLDLLTHQNKGFLNKKVYPELMYNEKTYDPRKEKVYDLVFALIDEIDSLIQPEAIHIGHDEVVGHTTAQAAEHGPILPASLFLYDVKKISNYLQQKNIQTWMWGDMLLETSRFPKMHPGSLNATAEYAQLIDSIPKHIIIGDWHYKHYKGKLKGKLTYPTIDYFEKHGFNVLGATWNVPEVTKAFSNYCYKPRHNKCIGMIATTWSLLLKESSQKHGNTGWPEVDAILQTSSEAFWNANPSND